MSTICKIDPMVRRRRAYRATAVRHPPPFSGIKGGRELYGKILGELALIHHSSRLTGATKDELFRRGFHQLRFMRLIHEAD